MKNLLILIMFNFTTVVCLGQVEEIQAPDYIKTITFKGNTPESQLPVLNLGDFIQLEFDALNGDEEDYYYRIQHYDYDWTPSVLAKAEYLSGYDEQRIRFYENSINTYQIYSHYQLRIPNQFTKAITKSGNYMIYILNDDEEIVFSRKFMIYENAAYVGVSVKRSRDVSEIKNKQTVDIVINPIDTNLNNPKTNIKTLIIQNNDLNSAIKNVKPQYILGNQLTYRYTEETSFDSGNEFYFFENKDLRVAVNGIQYVELNDLYEHILFSNISRKEQQYTYNPDINGNFLITAVDVENVNIEADYTFVHFSLIHPELSKNQSVHVYGNFNNYQINEDTKLNYYPEQQGYSGPILLKQGFYNYKYIVKDENSGDVDYNAIGGNFWQTENNYKVLVYYRDLGARYDRLIGFGETSSVNIKN